MKLPRDMGGEELATLLETYGYRITREAGSHMRLTSSYKGKEHHVTIPRHKPLRVGTLGSIVKAVATYLEINRERLMEDLFK
jgi:predicted RNA binding protein YcfA (HicA-like mRNA interferase family)